MTKPVRFRKVAMVVSSIAIIGSAVVSPATDLQAQPITIAYDFQAPRYSRITDESMGHNSKNDALFVEGLVYNKFIGLIVPFVELRFFKVDRIVTFSGDHSIDLNMSHFKSELERWYRNVPQPSSAAGSSSRMHWSNHEIADIIKTPGTFVRILWPNVCRALCSLIAIPVLASGFYREALDLRARRRVRNGQCAACGYNMFELECCPECGRPASNAKA